MNQLKKAFGKKAVTEFKRDGETIAVKVFKRPYTGVSEADIITQVQAYITSPAFETYAKTVDKIMFKALILEKLYCGYAAATSLELANYRRACACLETDKQNALANEIEADFYEDRAAKFEGRNQMIITKRSEAILSQPVLDAIDRSADLFNDFVELFLQYEIKQGERVSAALKRKTKGGQVKYITN